MKHVPIPNALFHGVIKSATRSIEVVVLRIELHPRI